MAWMKSFSIISRVKQIKATRVGLGKNLLQMKFGDVPKTWQEKFVEFQKDYAGNYAFQNMELEDF